VDLRTLRGSMPSSPLLTALATVQLAYALPAGAPADAACTMTPQGAGKFAIEMHNTHPIQPYKEIHCRFESTDKVLSFTGTDASGQCDACVKSSDESATCGCICPAGKASCAYKFTGTVAFDMHSFKNSTHSASCFCNGVPTPPKPQPTPPKPPPPPPPTPPPPPGPPPPCKAKLDVVIILDGSASIQSTDWQHELAFTNKIVDSFHLSADQVEIGALQFSGFAHKIIDLSPDANAVKAAVTNTNQLQTNTNTYRGFEMAKDMFSAHGRTGTKGKIAILITDGDQNQGLPAKLASDELKKNGVEIFGIGVGSQIDKAELEKWVSTPLSGHYFSVQSFATLEKILQSIVSGACPHPPTPLP